jgi:hypothetical protein
LLGADCPHRTQRVPERQAGFPGWVLVWLTVASVLLWIGGAVIVDWQPSASLGSEADLKSDRDYVVIAQGGGTAVLYDCETKGRLAIRFSSPPDELPKNFRYSYQRVTEHRHNYSPRS